MTVLHTIPIHPGHGQGSVFRPSALLAFASSACWPPASKDGLPTHAMAKWKSHFWMSVWHWAHTLLMVDSKSVPCMRRVGDEVCCVRCDRQPHTCMDGDRPGVCWLEGRAASSMSDKSSHTQPIGCSSGDHACPRAALCALNRDSPACLTPANGNPASRLNRTGLLP